jgi:monofunctional biosynthetic peptidoglycan transglycosylase
MSLAKLNYVATALILVSWVHLVRADEDQATLFDFSKSAAAKQWQTVNDGVMGGVSDGRFQITDGGIMEFFGTLSLENRGGFASVRSKAKPLELKDGDVIVARLRGDGREYYFNLRVPTRRIAFSYRASFETKEGEWQEVKVPLKDFQATSFGRPVRNAGPVEAGKVNSIGFLLADKKAGPFKLEIERIKVVRAAADE